MGVIFMARDAELAQLLAGGPRAENSPLCLVRLGLVGADVFWSEVVLEQASMPGHVLSDGHRCVHV